jgi:isocitrate dehydrogenase
MHTFGSIHLTMAEFEASHGTVADLWKAHLRGDETSMNPLGMVEAIMGAMAHASALDKLNLGPEVQRDMNTYVTTLRRALHNTFRYGQGTRDMAGPTGLTTEAFVSKVANRLRKYLAEQVEEPPSEELTPDLTFQKNYDVDRKVLEQMFKEYDRNQDGALTIDEVEVMLTKLGVAPLVDPAKKRTATEGGKQ